MRKFASIFFLFWTAFADQISIDPDGGYKGIVVKIDENVPETNCPQLLQKIQVRPKKRPKKFIESLTR